MGEQIQKMDVSGLDVVSKGSWRDRRKVNKAVRQDKRQGKKQAAETAAQTARTEAGSRPLDEQIRSMDVSALDVVKGSRRNARKVDRAKYPQQSRREVKKSVAQAEAAGARVEPSAEPNTVPMGKVVVGGVTPARVPKEKSPRAQARAGRRMDKRVAKVVEANASAKRSQRAGSYLEATQNPSQSAGTPLDVQLRALGHNIAVGRGTREERRVRRSMGVQQPSGREQRKRARASGKANRAATSANIAKQREMESLSSLSARWAGLGKGSE